MSTHISRLVSNFKEKPTRIGGELERCGEFLLSAVSTSNPDDLAVCAALFNVLSSDQDDQENLLDVASSLTFLNSVARFLQVVTEKGLPVSLEAVDLQYASLYLFEALARAQDVSREFVKTMMDHPAFTETMVKGITSVITSCGCPPLQELSFGVLAMLFSLLSSSGKAHHLKSDSVIPGKIQTVLQSCNLIDLLAPGSKAMRNLILDINRDNRNVESFHFNSFKNGNLAFNGSSGWMDICQNNLFFLFDSSSQVEDASYIELPFPDLTRFKFVLDNKSLTINGDYPSHAFAQDDESFEISFSFETWESCREAHKIVKSRVAATSDRVREEKANVRKLSTVSSKLCKVPPFGKSTSKNNTESCEYLTSPEPTPTKSDIDKNTVADIQLSAVKSLKAASKKGPKPAEVTTKPQPSKEAVKPQVPEDSTATATSSSKKNKNGAANLPSGSHQVLQPKKGTYSNIAEPTTSIPLNTETARMRKVDQQDEKSSAKSGGKTSGAAKSKDTATAVMPVKPTAPKREKRQRDVSENVANAAIESKVKTAKLGSKSNGTTTRSDGSLGGQDMEQAPTVDARQFDDFTMYTDSKGAFDFPQDCADSQTEPFSPDPPFFNNFDASGAESQALDIEHDSGEVEQAFTNLMKKLATMQSERERKKLDRTMGQAVKQVNRQIDDYLGQWVSMHQIELVHKEDQFVNKLISLVEVGEQLYGSVASDCTEVLAKAKEVDAENTKAHEKFRAAKEEYVAFQQRCKESDKRIKHELAKLRVEARETAKKSISTTSADDDNEKSTGGRKIDF